MKKIVIMMSTFNGEKYLSEQLESIYNQNTECKIELFVRDDYSTDRTIQILNLWKNKMNIKILNDSEKLGPARSFWKLFMNVPDADYYAFVDQDDVWDNNKIEKAIIAIEKENGPILWCSNCRVIDKCGSVISEKRLIHNPNLNIISQMICSNIQGCAMVFNKIMYEYIKKKNISYVPMHDFIVMMYALAKGKVVYDNDSTFSYRMHDNNVVYINGQSKMKAIKKKIKKRFGKESKYSVSRVASQILNNCCELDEQTKKYLKTLIKCRNSVFARIKIVTNKLTTSDNRKGTISFKIRVLLGIV